MPSRDLPARPDLDHLKHEARALRKAFMQGAAAAVERVHAVLGPRTTLKLTEAQRVIAREYGFPGWAKLRTHVLATRGTADAVNAFLAAVQNRDVKAAMHVLRTEPRITTASLHVAAALGLAGEVRRLVTLDPAQVNERAGAPAADPLLWLCYSPFHGESPERDEGLFAAASALLDAGADANTRDGQYGVPALYAVTGMNNAPRIARLLLDAGAEPTDGESVFHAAEQFHEEALELLLGYGADLNATGEWSNTPSYFLLRYHDVAQNPRVKQGLLWLFDHGADPNVRCGHERENALHVAARRGQQPDIVRLLLERGADVSARRGDGRTAWALARRGGFDELVALLEQSGAEPEPPSPEDALMAACGRGDVEAARALAATGVVEALDPADLHLLPEAAAAGRVAVVRACLAAGFAIDTTDEFGATALHHAAIHGRAGLVRELLRRGASFRIHDRQHSAAAIGWACFGADHVSEPDGDYLDTVRALLESGARLSADVHPPAHPGVREVLREFVTEQGRRA
jgi:ankyrin repeat protein